MSSSCKNESVEARGDLLHDLLADDRGIKAAKNTPAVVFKPKTRTLAKETDKEVNSRQQKRARLVPEAGESTSSLGHHVAGTLLSHRLSTRAVNPPTASQLEPLKKLPSLKIRSSQKMIKVQSNPDLHQNQRKPQQEQPRGLLSLKPMRPK